MVNYVYVVQREEYDKGCERNDPFGPSDTLEIISIYTSEETADKVCKEKTVKEASEYNTPFAVKKNGDGYDYYDNNGFVSYFYTKHEVKGE